MEDIIRSMASNDGKIDTICAVLFQIIITLTEDHPDIRKKIIDDLRTLGVTRPNAKLRHPTFGEAYKRGGNTTISNLLKNLEQNLPK